MEQTIFDEKNGLWYERQADYYIPCLKLPDDSRQPVGLWGQRHLHYIKQNRKAIYLGLLLDGRLNSYLRNIDKQADEMFTRLVTQFAEQAGATEHLKVQNQMEWIGQMNLARSRAVEIVNAELIYN